MPVNVQSACSLNTRYKYNSYIINAGINIVYCSPLQTAILILGHLQMVYTFRHKTPKSPSNTFQQMMFDLQMTHEFGGNIQ
jgi:hypothetical protein